MAVLERMRLCDTGHVQQGKNIENEAKNRGKVHKRKIGKVVLVSVILKICVYKRDIIGYIHTKCVSVTHVMKRGTKVENEAQNRKNAS